MGIEIPAAESLESPKTEHEVFWVKKATADKTGFVYSGKNTFKSGEGEFTVTGQGDNFAASHAYLLLVDVPGEKANSGATITAENSEGKVAAVSAETTATTQEISLLAGSESKTLLDGTGKSEFLQLAKSAKRKLAEGSATVTFGATNLSGASEVEHGLGVVPTNVQVSATPTGNSYIAMPYLTLVTKTNIGFGAFAPQGGPGSGQKATVYWKAVG